MIITDLYRVNANDGKLNLICTSDEKPALATAHDVTGFDHDTKFEPFDLTDEELKSLIEDGNLTIMTEGALNKVFAAADMGYHQAEQAAGQAYKRLVKARETYPTQEGRLAAAQSAYKADYSVQSEWEYVRFTIGAALLRSYDAQARAADALNKVTPTPAAAIAAQMAWGRYFKIARKLQGRS